MPLASEEDPPSVPERNPLVDTRDDVLGWIDKITRDVEAIKASKTSLSQAASRLNEIRASLPQLKTSLRGLKRLQSALKDADYNLGQLWEPTANGKRPKRQLVRAILEEITLELDDALQSALHEPELEQLALVEQESDLDNVAQIFLPPPPPRDPIRHPRGPIREGSRSLSIDTDQTEARKLHDALKSSRATPSHGVSGSLNPFTVDDLCDKIRSTHELGSIPIGDLYRREMPSGFQHEFILIKSAPAVGPSIWIRIDRAAKGYERGQVRTRYPANDTARMGGQEHQGQMIGKSRLRAHVVFRRQPDRPTLLTLAELIAVMRDESRYYRPLTENCYFFTSVIQEILTEHGGELVSGALGHKKLGRNVRRKIRRRFGIIASTGGSSYSVRSRDSDHYASSHNLRPSHKSWGIVRLLPKFFHVAPCHTNARIEAEGLGVNHS